MPTDFGKKKGVPAMPGHESSDESDGYESDPEFEVELMQKLRGKVDKYKKELGMDHLKTLRKVFRLLNLYIQHYMLDIMDDLLQEFADVCTRTYGSTDYIRYIQMLGFCRWKQHRLREALALFHEQEAIMGDNEILCENIGHTYSSLGDFDAAVASFQKGLYLLGVNGDPGRKAGFYYGMALAKDRLGSSEESIPLLHAALDGYRQERVDPSGNPIDSSIHAKVQMSLGHMHEKLGNLEEAAKFMAESVRVFRKCVGNQNPLTAGAVGALGKIKLALGHRAEALALLTEALEGEARKDAFQLSEAFMLLFEIQAILTTDFDTASAAASESAGGGGGGGGGGGAAKAPEAVVAGLEQKFKPYVKVCRLLVKRCMPSTVQGKSGDGLKSKAGGGSKSDGTSAGGRSEGEAGGPEGKGGGPEGKGGGPEGAAGGSESEAFGAGGDTAVMFKVVAEIFLAAGHYKESVKASEVALSIFPKIVGLDCSNLVNSAKQCRDVALSMLAKQAHRS